MKKYYAVSMMTDDLFEIKTEWLSVISDKVKPVGYINPYCIFTTENVANEFVKDINKLEDSIGKLVEFSWDDLKKLNLTDSSVYFN